MLCVTVLSVLFIVNGLVTGQEGKCTTSEGRSGRCKSIFNCEQMLEIAKKRNKDAQDLLRQSHCGFLGTTPKVCCPEQDPQPTDPRSPKNQCYTPDFKIGQCVGVYSCPHLATLLKEPVSEQNLQHVNRFRCNGPVQNSVCCELDTTSGNKPKDKCKASVSALPPDPTSQCCGLDASAGNKIYGGTETAIDEYPWLALIEYESNSITQTLCGGSLISGRYVLTAGHCVIGSILKNGRPIRIRLGEYDKDHEGPDCKTSESGGVDCTDGTIRIPIEKAIPHPEYNPNSVSRRHDIALIRMNRLAPFTEFIRPICLPTMDFTLTADSSYNLTTSGWGAVSARARSSAVKLYVDLPYIVQDNCQLMFDRLATKITLWKGQLCAGGEQGRDSCKGDSGGPLMLLNGRRHDIIGVASFGHKDCGTKNVPGVYTKVYEYDSWIRSNILP
ncbi:unnamed protein product [Arctia plantaginis]|uniref:CLIP domain-containing serine protease n=1 Tax=Arctia plantaginis TaxID=874455 RepID=A0A8S0Z2M7_ARCPL|nr:unnamed protein product [Arctia plantaginis]